MSTVPVSPVFQAPPTGVDEDTTPARTEEVYGVAGEVVTGTNIGFGTIDLSPGETSTITFDMGIAFIEDIASGVTDDGTGINPIGPFVPNDSTAYVNLLEDYSPSPGNIAAMARIGTLSLVSWHNPAPGESVDNAGIFTLTLSHAEWAAAGSPQNVLVRLPTDARLQDAFYFLTVTCFAAGTEIATPSGGTAVEALKPGDLVRTVDGRDVPVRWVWRQTIRTAFDPVPERLSLVRIAAGALGGGLPRRDLRLTADHALLVDEVLVNAGALVNGTTIRFEPLSRLPASFEVYHIETEAHDLLMAEGVATESFVDYISRENFDNHDAYLARHGEAPLITEMPRPRVSTARLVPSATKQRIAG